MTWPPLPAVQIPQSAKPLNAPLNLSAAKVEPDSLIHTLYEWGLPLSEPVQAYVARCEAFFGEKYGAPLPPSLLDSRQR